MRCIALFVFLCLGIPNSGATLVEVRLRYGNEPLRQGRYYPIFSGDSVRVDVCRFYLSGFEFRSRDGKILRTSDLIMLCDLMDEKSLSAELPSVPASAEILRIRTGIDSITHTKGIQRGKLDPVHGMYWTWQTGFIQFKIEGYCSAAKSPDKSFMLHLGGFLPPNVCSNTMDIKIQDRNNIRLNVNIERFLKGLSFGEYSEIMSPGGMSTKLCRLLPFIFELAE